MFGIPLELVTMVGSGLMSGLLALWAQSMRARQQAHDNAIEALKTRAGITERARQYNAPGVAFTRRVLALSAVGAVIVLPKVLAAFYPEIPVTVGWTEFDPGFLFFTEGHDAVKWETMQGLVLTPLDTHFMSAVVGFYFGASIVRNAR